MKKLMLVVCCFFFVGCKNTFYVGVSENSSPEEVATLSYYSVVRVSVLNNGKPHNVSAVGKGKVILAPGFYEFLVSFNNGAVTTTPVIVSDYLDAGEQYHIKHMFVGRGVEFEIVPTNTGMRSATSNTSQDIVDLYLRLNIGNITYSKLMAHFLNKVGAQSQDCISRKSNAATLTKFLLPSLEKVFTPEQAGEYVSFSHTDAGELHYRIWSGKWTEEQAMNSEDQNALAALKAFDSRFELTAKMKALDEQLGQQFNMLTAKVAQRCGIK